MEKEEDISGSADFQEPEKTLLLYDIAMKLSVRQRVCIIHCGEAGKEWKILMNVCGG